MNTKIISVGDLKLTPVDLSSKQARATAEEDYGFCLDEMVELYEVNIGETLVAMAHRRTGSDPLPWRVDFIEEEEDAGETWNPAPCVNATLAAALGLCAEILTRMRS